MREKNSAIDVAAVLKGSVHPKLTDWKSEALKNAYWH